MIIPESLTSKYIPTIQISCLLPLGSVLDRLMTSSAMEKDQQSGGQRMVEKTWKKAIDGFPQNEFVGRIGFDFAQSNPDVVYALHDNQGPSDKEQEEPRRRRNQEENPLEFEDFKTMSVEDAMGMEDNRLNSFLRRNQFASKYTASEIKRQLRTGKITTAQIAEYNGNANDANAALFSAPNHRC